MKYKVGDKVKLKDEDGINDVSCVNNIMPKWCGQIATIVELTGHGSYRIDLDLQKWCWTDEMIECLVEQERKEVQMNYKVGDKVKLKSKSKLDNYEYDTVSEMIAFGGQVATITSVNDRNRYRIDLDLGRWNWDNEMIEELILNDESEEVKVNRLKVGDKVKIKDNVNNLRGACYPMKEYSGDIATITEVRDSISYGLDIDSGRWHWYNNLFDVIKDESEEVQMSILKVGDKVRINNDLSSSDYNVAYGMEEFRGVVATIESLGEKEYSGLQKYYLDIDDGSYYWTTNMFTSKALTSNFKQVVSEIEEGQTYVSKDGERTLTLKDGLLITQGFDEEFTLDEEFKLVKILTVQEVVKIENQRKQYKVIFNSDDDDMLVTVEVYGDDCIELEDEDGDDIYETVSLLNILEAKYIEV